VTVFDHEGAMDLTTVKPEDVIRAKKSSDDIEPLEEYRTRRETVWCQIMRVRQELRYLEAMHEFDYNYDKKGFFDHVLVMLIESVAMGLYRLTEDNNGSPNFANLRVWKNQLVPLTKEDLRKDVGKVLADARISKRINDVLDHIRDVRNDVIGHLSDKALVEAGKDGVYGVVMGFKVAEDLSLDFFQSSVEEIEEMFKVLCFGEQYHPERSRYVGLEADEIDLYRYLEKLFGEEE
jgi:hypothetical protein